MNFPCGLSPWKCVHSILSPRALLNICQQGSPNRYHVCEARQGLKLDLRIPDIVTFSSATEYPLPHPAFLALHALCCEAAWISGAAEYIMDIERKMDETRVLANDGSTADVSMCALALVETR